jgi:hypothetical protein
MLPSESPFPCHWWGIGLEDAGLDDLRPNIGTYGRYTFDRLPPLPVALRGNFAWLAAAKTHAHSIGDEKAADNAQAILLLKESAALAEVWLPEPFVKFLETPALHRRIRSNTDCYIDLCPELIQSPVGGGHLVRFLADSQGCVFWYLYLPSARGDHAVVSSPDFYGTETEQWQDDPPDPASIAFCAVSFEEFLCRFWLENEIWFAGYEKTAISDAGRDYIKRYRTDDR